MIFLRQIETNHDWNLYDTDRRDRGGLLTDEYLSSEITSKELTDEQQRSLDDKISTNEYFETLKSFQTNKTPGDDGLTVEFYLGFWHLVGKCLVNALSFAHEKDQFIQLSETDYDYFARKER